MVGKLMKHELYAFLRILSIFGAVVFVLSCVTSILLTGEPNTASMLLLLGSIYGIVALFFASFVLSIVRLSKMFFTGEGYMELSIPVTPSQLLVSKLLSAIIAAVFCWVVAIVSIMILVLGAGETIVEFFRQASSSIVEGFSAIFKSEPLLALEGVLLLIVIIPLQLFEYYAILAVGQLFTKNRKLLTVLLFVVFFAFVGPFVLQGFMVIVVHMMQISLPMFHLAMWLSIIVIAAIETGCFFLVRYIMKNHVNLIV